MWDPSRNLVNKVTKKSIQWLNSFEKIKLLLWQESEYSLKLNSERIFKIYFSSFTSKGFSCSTIEFLILLCHYQDLLPTSQPDRHWYISTKPMYEVLLRTLSTMEWSELQVNPLNGLKHSTKRLQERYQHLHWGQKDVTLLIVIFSSFV